MVFMFILWLGKLYNKVVSGFDYLILVEVMDYANYNQMKESKY
jgi:DNA-binding protein Fis